MGTTDDMYEIEIDGERTVMDASTLWEAWKESVPDVLATAIVLPVGGSSIVCAQPRIVLRRIR